MRAANSSGSMIQTYKLALHLYALQKVSGSYYYALEDILYRLQGPDGGFHTGYDQAGTYAGSLENAETTSIYPQGFYPAAQQIVI